MAIFFQKKNIEKHHWNEKNKWQFERKNPTTKIIPTKKINRTLKPFSLGGLKPRHRPAKQRLPTNPRRLCFESNRKGNFQRCLRRLKRHWLLKPMVSTCWFGRFGLCNVWFQVSKANGGWEPNSERLWVVVSHEGPWPSTCDRCPWLWRMMSAWIRRLDCKTGNMFQGGF